MEDRNSQFVIAVADMCAAASLASLEVELRLRDGDLVRGVPEAPQPATGPAELDESGYHRDLIVDLRAVELSAIVACTIHAADAGT